jgi:hypothetical protein
MSLYTIYETLKALGKKMQRMLPLQNTAKELHPYYVLNDIYT